MRSAAAEDTRPGRVAHGRVVRHDRPHDQWQHPSPGWQRRLRELSAGANGQPLTSIVRLGPKPEMVAELPTGTLVAFDRTGKRLFAWLRFVTTAIPARRPAGRAGRRERIARTWRNRRPRSGRGEERRSDTGRAQVAVWSADGQRVLFLGADPGLTRRVRRARGRPSPSGLTDRRLSNFCRSQGGAQVEPSPRSAAGKPSTPARPWRKRWAAGGAGRGNRRRCGGGRRPGRIRAAAVAAAGRAPTFGVVDSGQDDAHGHRQRRRRVRRWRHDRVARPHRRHDCPLKMTPSTGGRPRWSRTATRLDAPALSPDGKQVAYQTDDAQHDWEIYVSDGPAPIGASRATFSTTCCRDS